MKIALVCTHGGHLTEILQLMDAFRDYEIFIATNHSSREDEVRRIANTYFTDNFGYSPWRIFKGFFWAFRILSHEKPKVIVSMGAEIAVPFFLLAKLFGIRTLFIESWCRVNNLSLTGKLVYPITDEFWVQWPQLLETCGSKAKYKGAIV